MPELPDVETFRRYFDSTAAGKQVGRVRLKDRQMLGAVSPQTLRRSLKGKRLHGSRRHGKYMFCDADGRWLVLHFGMTGYLRYFHDQAEEPTHTRMLLELADERRLAYVCQRRLGKIDLAADPESYVEERGLGPDALEISSELFCESLGSRRKAVKQALMDQAIVAGVGNIYADEILFQTGIWPAARCERLDEAALGKLHRTMRRVLERAIERHADPARMPKTWLLPNREEGADCPRCDGKLERSRLGGRGTFACRACQPIGAPA